MGYIQEARAEEAVAALRRMAAAHANVIRGGARQSVAAAEVVPGDILLIEEGDTIAADARVVQSTRAADRGGGAHRREPAGLEGHRAARRRSRSRRSPQHGVQRHRGDLRPRQGGGHGDRDADRDGAHRGHAARKPRPRPRRCRRSSRASAGCSASSSSPSRVVMIGTILLVEDVRGFAALFECSSWAWRWPSPPCRKACPRWSRRCSRWACSAWRSATPSCATSRRSRRSARRASSPPTRPAR